MGSKKVKAPEPRSYKQEMLDAMSAQEAIQPRLLELERQYTPLYQQLQNENQIRGMQYMQDAYGASIPRSAQLSQQYAEAMQPAFAGIGTTARNAYNATLDPSVSGLMSALGTQATADLARGTALSPEEQRQSQQAARIAMAARGLSGNQAVAQEVLNNYNLGQARQNAARQFAGSVYGMGQQAAQQAMGMYGNNMLGAAQAFSPASMYGSTAQMNQGLGAQLFQPESQYNAGLITANRKEAMDAQIANAQSRNALTSGLMSMAGMAAGGFLGNPSLFGATGATGAAGGGGSLGGFFSSASGGSSLGGGLNLGNYSLGGGGAGLSNMSGGGYSFSSGNGFNKMQ
jgi:hypothetical protein